MSAEKKNTNPKQNFADSKVPLHLVPESSKVAIALALMSGAQIYGGCNWRAMGVLCSTYDSALQRHIGRWWEGEDLDPDTGLPHLFHAAACIAILIDAGAVGNLTDDRPYPGRYPEFLAAMSPHVERLKALRAGKPVPHHWTIRDAPVPVPPPVAGTRLSDGQVDSLLKLVENDGVPDAAEMRALVAEVRRARAAAPWLSDLAPAPDPVPAVVQDLVDHAVLAGAIEWGREDGGRWVRRTASVTLVGACGTYRPVLEMEDGSYFQGGVGAPHPFPGQTAADYGAAWEPWCDLEAVP